MKQKRKTFIGCVVGAFGLVLMSVATISYWSASYWSAPSVAPVQHAMVLPDTDSNIRFSERAVRLPPVNVGMPSHGFISAENTGDKVVENTVAMSNCSCSAITLSNTMISPGESIQIDFTIETRGRNADFVIVFVFRYSEDGQSRFDTFYVTVPVILPNSEN